MMKNEYTEFMWDYYGYKTIDDIIRRKNVIPTEISGKYLCLYYVWHRRLEKRGLVTKHDNKCRDVIKCTLIYTLKYRSKSLLLDT